MSSGTVCAEKGEEIQVKKKSKKSAEASPENDALPVVADKVELVSDDGQPKDQKKPARKQKRDANGRFVKGSKPPKSPGRPRKPQELEKLMPQSIKTIENILNGKTSSEKLKFEAAKWVVEMNIGKPSQQVDATVEGNTNLSAVVLNFEGELEKWSE